ncbi:MAG: 16S rRNA (cytosine(1402)-N(4))-methyltransferase RsmH [Phycisphaerales bacterium]|nr:16S rRNA (cytosine(1402)-N(4))-methyltransferase RsmH [Phycisphaerales bacterium]
MSDENTELGHIPVLPNEVVELLDPQKGETFVDCTAGLGGHAAMIAEKIGPNGIIVLNDLDQSNLNRAKLRVAKALCPENPGSARVHAILGNFSELPRKLKELELSADMILADLGFASTQVDDPDRGLSFRFSGPLDMRMDQSSPITAEELVNTLPERELADIIWRYGEEKSARRIASKLVAAREVEPITTTDRLAELVRSVSRGPRGSINPATKTFQALRIAVNDELGSLEALLRVMGIALRKKAQGEDSWIQSNARIALISFHSLEDRPVKRAFGEWKQTGWADPITKGVITGTESEISSNPRARSAKLRVCRSVRGNAC